MLGWNEYETVRKNISYDIKIVRSNVVSESYNKFFHVVLSVNAFAHNAIRERDKESSPLTGKIWTSLLRLPCIDNRICATLIT